MADKYESAELLTALWRLGGSGNLMPTSHGILDKALFRIKNELPTALSETLTFSNTSVGLRCFELPAILLAAQDSLLTSEPNPTYLSTVVLLDEDSARQIVVGAALSTREARRIGELLHGEVDAVRVELGTQFEAEAA